MVELIETEKTILRLVTKDDVDAIYRLTSDEEVIKFVNMSLHKNRKDTEKLIDDYLKEYATGNKYPFVIVYKETNEVIGVFLLKVDVHDDEYFQYTVYIDKKMWGKGICTEVLTQMIQFAFEKLKIKNLRGYIREGNSASRRVLLKCGFKFEKIHRIDPAWGKIECYLWTRDDYLRNKLLNK